MASAGLYPELDEAALAQIVNALESGDTAGLAPARAEEVDEARARVIFSRVRVPGEEGIELDGALWAPTGDGPFPVVVMPAPWADLGWIAYVAQATQLALKGYVVLAYTPRGFGKSGGEVEVAGPLDIQDGTAALDFVLVNSLNVDPSRIGFLGDSYGSGISQLVAAHDPRVRVVGALSTWGSLFEAFYENDTRHTASVDALRGAARNARLSERTQWAFEQMQNGDGVSDELKEWAYERSPLTYVERLNQQNAPIFFSHAWHETLFPVNQTLELFHQLTGPKRLDLSIGDHSSPEMTGLIGLPNRIWSDAHRWLDYHLKGVGEAAEDSVISEIMWSKTLESHPVWEAAIGDPVRFHLTGPADGATDGGLADKPQNGWSTVVSTGTDTPATVADAIIKTGYAEMAGKPKTYPTAQISRTDAAVWTSEPLTETAKVRGIPRLRLTYQPSTANATFIAYLFDAAPGGNASLITHAPFTTLGAAPGEPIAADIELQAAGYDVPAEHRLMLVLDTQDPFYGDANEPGGKLILSSPDDNPSHLDVPLA
ncbi:CocE/NonD family hydrolase [Streptomyces noursei]|uniref:CocE/NonD family hydrolase n=1 Tax=Streptomyces noursei TaxID=1971 RepID=UPI0005C830B4|nr:CocE/NonD family hydrolase [Streptomyces noursei]